MRRAILDAALAALREGDVQALTFRELARTAKVAHSALYHHFRDRGELLAVVAGEGFGILLARLLEAAACGSTVDSLGAVVRAYVRFAREHPAYYRIMYLPEVTRPENVAHVEPNADACFAVLTRAIAALNGDDALESRALGVWSALHGLIVLGADAGPLTRKLAPESEADFAVDLATTLAAALRFVETGLESGRRAAST